MKILPLLSFRSLRRNKTKTLITAIGILLSVVLLATIGILAFSYKTTLIATTIEKRGDWHFFIVNDEDNSIFNSIQKDKIEKYMKLNELGYSQIEDVQDLDKPYLQITSIYLSGGEIFPINILEGRMPENENEVIIPIGYAELYGKSINNILTLNIGKRFLISDEYQENELHLNSSYAGANEEYIESGYTKDYVIVGISETIDFVEYSFSPGYTILTYTDSETYTKGYVKLNNPDDYYDILNSNGGGEYFSSNNIINNNELYDILGLGKGDSSGKIFNTIIIILCIIIFINCFVLIYNSYMLTINERAKEYALLNSVGATTKQLFGITIFENLILALVIIPIGILISILIISLSLNNISALISTAFYSDLVFELNLNASLIAVIFAISIFMIMVASMITFLINHNKIGISGLRQNGIIKTKTPKNSEGKKNKTKAYKNTEFDFIAKNYKRNKNKYKFTVISIIISMTLFLSTDIFCTYALNQITEENDIIYDISCSSGKNELDYAVNTMYRELSNVDGIDNSWWEIKDNLGSCIINNDDLSEVAQNIFIEDRRDSVNVFYVVLEENMYKKLIDSVDKDISIYKDKNNLKAVATAKYTDYSNEENVRYDIFNSSEISLDIEKNDNTLINSISLDLISTLPKELGDYNTYNDGVVVFLPMETISEYLITVPQNIEFFFICDDHATVYDEMTDIKELNGWDFYINDYAESFDVQLNLIKVIEIFANIFLLTVIGISILNIFNTVFSTLIMRRKEFAIMTSVGMLDKSINKIVFLENIFTSGTAITISIALSMVISLLLKMVFEFDGFIYPVIKSIILISIFLFSMFCACLISLKINNKANIINTLKKDFI